MNKKPYRATRPDIEWIAGRRVQADAPLLLTDREAAPELARGLIELADPAPSEPTVKPRKPREE